MLAQEVDPTKSKTVIEYSSGSTVISLALASRINHGISDVRAFLSNKTSPAKLRLMQFFGLDVYHPTSPKSGVQIWLIFLLGHCLVGLHNRSRSIAVEAFVEHNS
jgi:hypothetical protein